MKERIYFHVSRITNKRNYIFSIIKYLDIFRDVKFFRQMITFRLKCCSNHCSSIVNEYTSSGYVTHFAKNDRFKSIKFY